MTAQELGDAINLLTEDQLKLEVRIDAGHGQTAMAANFAGPCLIYEDEYMAETVAEGDEEDDHVAVFLLTD